MDVVGGDHIVEDSKSVTLSGFIEPMKPAIFIFGKFEQEFSFMAPVGNVPDKSRQIMSFGSSH
jgi:hypothetical protein